MLTRTFPRMLAFRYGKINMRTAIRPNLEVIQYSVASDCQRIPLFEIYMAWLRSLISKCTYVLTRIDMYVYESQHRKQRT